MGERSRHLSKKNIEVSAEELMESHSGNERRAGLSKKEDLKRKKEAEK